MFDFLYKCNPLKFLRQEEVVGPNDCVSVAIINLNKYLNIISDPQKILQLINYVPEEGASRLKTIHHIISNYNIIDCNGWFSIDKEKNSKFYKRSKKVLYNNITKPIVAINHNHAFFAVDDKIINLNNNIQTFKRKKYKFQVMADTDYLEFFVIGN